MFAAYGALPFFAQGAPANLVEVPSYVLEPGSSPQVRIDYLNGLVAQATKRVPTKELAQVVATLGYPAASGRMGARQLADGSWYNPLKIENFRATATEVTRDLEVIVAKVLAAGAATKEGAASSTSTAPSPALTLFPDLYKKVRLEPTGPVLAVEPVEEASQPKWPLYAAAGVAVLGVGYLLLGR